MNEKQLNQYLFSKPNWPEVFKIIVMTLTKKEQVLLVRISDQRKYKSLVIDFDYKKYYSKPTYYRLRKSLISKGYITCEENSNKIMFNLLKYPIIPKREFNKIMNLNMPICKY